MINYMRDPSKIGIPGIASGLEDLAREVSTVLRGRKEMWELGSFAGESAAIFAKFFKTVHCVDPWEGFENIKLPADPNIHPEDIERNFDEIAREHPGIVKHKGIASDFVEGVADNSVGFVYVDTGDHHYELTLSDIAAWWPKVRWGGFLGGHDYCAIFADVEKAVRVYFGKKLLKMLRLYSDTSWCVRKT